MCRVLFKAAMIPGKYHHSGPGGGSRKKLSVFNWCLKGIKLIFKSYLIQQNKNWLHSSFQTYYGHLKFVIDRYSKLKTFLIKYFLIVHCAYIIQEGLMM